MSVKRTDSLARSMFLSGRTLHSKNWLLSFTKSFRPSSCYSSCNKCLCLRTENPCLPKSTSISSAIQCRPISFDSKRCISIKTFPLQNKVVPFNLSDIGEGIAEVTIKEWYVIPGQKVAQFDSICEVQSDKASVTITSKFDGVIRRLYYEVDATARVGLPLVDIELHETGGEDKEREKDEINDQDASDPVTQPDIIPSKVLRKVPEEVEMFSQQQSSQNSIQDRHSYKKTLATPAVRRLAMENNIDLNLVPGSGKDGRIMKEDVLDFLNQAPGQQSTSREPLKHLSQEQPSTTDHKVLKRKALTDREDKKEALTAVQRAMLKSMTESLKIPHLSLADDIEVSSLVHLKSSVFSDVARETGISMTFLPFFMKAASLALEEFPGLNASLDESEMIMIHKSSHNIGFAMDTPSGLIVPNVKDVQSKSIVEIAFEIKRMQEEGKFKGSVHPKDLSGGTFTLSNIGSIGGTFGVPVILPPQVVIGAFGRIQAQAMFDDKDNIVKRHILKVVWSADHRVIDGATITKFNNKWKSFVQEPTRMLLHLK